jgi:hypothetical protein
MMLKTKILFLSPLTASLLSLLISSCASGLKKSEFNSNLQMQGSYSCPAHPLKTTRLETPSEADTMRVRCYRDDWSIEFNHVTFNRVLYTNAACEKPIGRVVLEVPARIEKAKMTLEKGKCQLLKTSADWIAEDEGKCMLQHLPLNTSSTMQPLEECRSSLPVFCFESAPTIQLVSEQNPKTNNQLLLVKATTARDQEKCERYESNESTP